jgi:predicted metal-dependent phosphoesterase TrpH
MALNYESLHNHTTASDGHLDHLDLLAKGYAEGFGLMAFTDHDVLPNDEALAKLKEYDGPVKWLTGVEISSGLPKELGGGAASMFHILGLFVDPHNKDLKEHCRLAVAARNERMERIVANLRSLGFDITEADCLADSGGEAVGRKNISRALYRSKGYDEVMNRLRNMMAAEAVEDMEVAMQYSRMMDGPASDHAFVLFLSNDSYIEDVYVDYLYSTDMDKSVELIRNAGGIAVLAHWATVEKQIPLTMLEGFLKDKRLDGVELRTSFTDDEQEGQEVKLREMAERTSAVTTYGIDGHANKDIESFGRNQPLAERTIGQTEVLIRKFKPELKYSNLK